MFKNHNSTFILNTRHLYIVARHFRTIDKYSVLTYLLVRKSFIEMFKTQCNTGVEEINLRCFQKPTPKEKKKKVNRVRPT